MTSTSTSTPVRRRALGLLAGAAFALAGATTALGGANGTPFTSVTGDFGPGGTLTVVFPCGDPDFGSGNVSLSSNGFPLASNSHQGAVIADEFQVTIVIPANISAGTQVQLTGNCVNSQSETSQQFGPYNFAVAGAMPSSPSTTTTVVQTPSTDQVGSGGGTLPATGSSSTLPLVLLAGGLVATGLALRTRRRTAD